MRRSDRWIGAAGGARRPSADRAVKKRVIIGSVVVVAVLAAAAAVIVWRVGDPGPASLDEAVERFEGGDDSGTTPPSGRPPEGVYEYDGDGTERLSVPPVSQQYGAVVPGTVTHEGAACWVLRLDFNAAHWQEWRFCPSDGRIGDAGGRTHQAWDLGVTSITSLATFTCDPPGPLFPPDEPGWTVDHSCSGTNDQVAGRATSTGPWRYIGPEMLTVGGEAVEAWRFHQERTIGGAQDGSQVSEAWFAQNGLLLRLEREIDVDSPSPIGDVTYTETGAVELADLDPRR